MKFILFVCCAAVVILGVVGQGIPIAKCRPGEHSVLYCPQRAEPNCDNPTVHDMEVAGPCDIPQCFCNTPNVRNLKTGKCIPYSKCP
ncbi:unnamed protein product [Leptosia nina]|uniref:Protease inhibitor n=1 Tax=Leptosia nina TaxID=320188 RepID=A0AAV1JNL7_9NEOP